MTFTESESCRRHEKLLAAGSELARITARNRQRSQRSNRAIPPYRKGLAIKLQ
jgi:hypothetical protein